jgi:hypothetical protein
MNITATGLTKAAATAAVAAGTIFIAVQINHPATDTFTTETAQWVARSCAKMAMAALALAGITGMYLRQYRKAGLLGLLGYLLFAAGYLVMFSMEAIAGTALPSLVNSEPGFVNDAVGAAAGATPHASIGGLQTLFALGGAGYILGGLIFGIALFRTGVLARWAAALLALSAVATAALAVLPEAFNRPVAVPVGIALIGLGVSLWGNPSDAADTSVQSSAATTLADTLPATSQVQQPAAR